MPERTMDVKLEVSEGYRKARGKHAVVAAVSIAWGAAQIEIGTMSLGVFTSNIVTSSAVIVGLFSLLLYFSARTVIEYAMQTVEVRRWRLAQLDFHLALNLFRISLFVLTVSTVSRNQESAVKATLGLLLMLIAFCFIFGVIYLVVCAVYIPLRTISLKRSVVGAVMESLFISVVLTALAISFLIEDQLRSTPRLAFIPNFLPDSGTPLQQGVIATVAICILLSFLRSDLLLRRIFAYAPKRIGEHYTENGRHFYREDWNPEHPDYDDLKKSSSPFVVEKISGSDKAKE